MPNTSATGGYLAPTSAPVDDDALDDLMQSVIVGVTGMVGNMVRPAFQDNPPARPGISVNWCGFQVMSNTPEAGVAYMLQGDGGAVQTRHESFELRCSFYGPSCRGMAGLLRDGLQIKQNRDVLFENDIAYVGSTGILNVPDEANGRYYKRADITLTFNRQLDRDYPILPFVQAVGTIVTEDTTTEWATGPEV